MGQLLRQGPAAPRTRARRAVQRQRQARGRWREVGTPAGPIPAMLPPGSWNEGPRMDPVPALGEHTDAILQELGLDAQAIRGLRAAKAI